jgi:hypothetical protein
VLKTFVRRFASSVEQHYKSCIVGYVNVTKTCCKVNAELSDDHRSDSESELFDNDDHSDDDDDDDDDNENDDDKKK